MIKVLFFAQTRELLNTAELAVSERPCTVGELRKLLWQKGPDWLSLLTSDKTLVAVNQSISDDDTPLSSGDEVAFFPPVTGG